MKNIFRKSDNVGNLRTLYCHNNELTTMEQVVSWFVLYLGYEIGEAVMMAYIINDSKKAIVFKGEIKQLEQLSKIFNSKGLETSIE